MASDVLMIAGALLFVLLILYWRFVIIRDILEQLDDILAQLDQIELVVRRAEERQF